MIQKPLSERRFRPVQRAVLRALALPAMMTVMALSPVAAKTLVFCSEGSPENFYPGVNTTGTSFDASEPVYNRLVEFEYGGTKVVPGLAEKWDISTDGKEYTFHLRKGVKWHASNKAFKPTRDMNADDVLFMFERQWKEDNPFFKVTNSNHTYFNDMGMPKLIKSVEKVDAYTVKITLDKPEAPFLANLAMPYAAVQSKEYADAMLKAGTPEKIDQDPIGNTKNVASTAKRRSQNTGLARPKSTTWCMPSHPMHPCAGPSCKKASAMSCPTPTRPTWKRSVKTPTSRCWSNPA